MDINRLKKLAGMLNESVEIEEGVRDATNRIYEMMDEGILDPRTVAEACLQAMSEDDVARMAHAEEFFDYDEDDEDEDEEDDFYTDKNWRERYGDDDDEDEDNYIRGDDDNFTDSNFKDPYND
jgi:hypothetical protein